MQTVRQNDTMKVYWRVVDETTKQPVDLTGATAEVHVAPIVGSQLGPVVTIPAEIVPPETDGRVRHSYDMLAAGSYALEVQVTGVLGIQTAPTAKNETLRVVPEIA